MRKLFEPGMGYISVCKTGVGKTYRWRLYTVIQTSTTAWRGSNDEVRVIRGQDFGEILSFPTMEAAKKYAKEHLGEDAMFDG